MVTATLLAATLFDAKNYNISFGFVCFYSKQLFQITNPFFNRYESECDT
jgi:hypothetical protein